jgi:L-alanine-DL-glutamate epimerase-like enolase superfamily enzyme
LRKLRQATVGQYDFKDAVHARIPGAVDLSEQRAVARTLAEFAVVSALDQAVWDLLARQCGINVSAALGAVQRDRIPVYADINRGIAARTPDGFVTQGGGRGATALPRSRSLRSTR